MHKNHSYLKQYFNFRLPSTSLLKSYFIMKKIKKTYRYALWSALYSTSISVVVALLSYFLLINLLGIGAVLVFGIVMFTFVANYDDETRSRT